jgi:stage III sporulation protein AC
MGVDLIFKIAAIGILVAILHTLLDQTGRKELALMTTIIGLVVVLMMVVKEIVNLFDTIKTLFQF